MLVSCQDPGAADSRVPRRGSAAPGSWHETKLCCVIVVGVVE